MNDLTDQQVKRLTGWKIDRSTGWQADGWQVDHQHVDLTTDDLATLNLWNCQPVNLSTCQPVDPLNRKYFDLSTCQPSSCQSVYILPANASTCQLATCRPIDLSICHPFDLTSCRWISDLIFLNSICLNIKIRFYSFKIKKKPSTRYPCLYITQIII